MLSFVERAKARAVVFFVWNVIEDKVTLDYRREARELVLQSSSFGGFVFFRDFFQDRD